MKNLIANRETWGHRTGAAGMMFDDAELTITWIPEPVGLLSIGLIGIATIRSRLRFTTIPQTLI